MTDAIQCPCGILTRATRADTSYQCNVCYRKYLGYDSDPEYNCGEMWSQVDDHISGEDPQIAKCWGCTDTIRIHNFGEGDFMRTHIRNLDGQRHKCFGSIRGVSDDELGDRLGKISPATLGQWEQGFVSSVLKQVRRFHNLSHKQRGIVERLLQRAKN